MHRRRATSPLGPRAAGARSRVDVSARLRALVTTLTAMVVAIAVGGVGAAHGADEGEGEGATEPGPAVAELVSQLAACEASDCAAMRALVARGEAVWPDLGVGLDSDDEMTRFWTIGVIAELELAAARERLVTTLAEDTAVRIRAASAFALGNIGGAEVAAPLASALGDEDVNVRFEAASALGRARRPEAVPALIEALRDDDAQVKAAAVEALGLTGDRRAVAPLTRRLRSPTARVRGYVAMALGMLEAEAAVEELIARAGVEADAQALSATLWALGEIGDREALDAVRAHRDASDEGVRRHAREAIAKLSPPDEGDGDARGDD